MVFQKKRSNFTTLWLFVLLHVTAGFTPNAYKYNNRCISNVSGTSVDDDDGGGGAAAAATEKLSADSIYFDIEVANQSIGRLIFHLTNPSTLPKHTENIIQLANGSRRGIDSKAHYVGCEFDFSPSSVEDGMGRYRWGHQLRGRGANAVGPANELISDPLSKSKCTHSVFGGQYYGDLYEENVPGVVLTVPVTGPGHGSSKFSIIRINESPMEWKERLAINQGIVGHLDPSCINVLHAMARQRMGPPTVVAAGTISSD